MNDDFCRPRAVPTGSKASVSENDEFCNRIKNEKLHQKNEEFWCIKSKEFASKEDGFCIKNDEFCIKKDELFRYRKLAEIKADKVETLILD